MIALQTSATRPDSLPHRRHLALSTFWFGLFASWTSLVFVVLYFIAFYPTQIPLVFATAVVFGIGCGLYLRSTGRSPATRFPTAGRRRRTSASSTSP